MDRAAIVHDGVLSREGNALPTNTRSAYKHISVKMKAVQGSFEFLKGINSESITAGDIAEVKEGRKRLHHRRWYITDDRCKVDLKCVGLIPAVNVENRDYLHKRFGVITSPLRKVTAIWEAS